MKNKLTRFLCLALCLCILIPCLSSCKSEWDKEGKKVIGTCGEYDVLYEELRFVTLYYKASFEATYGAGIWDDPTTAEQYREELEAVVWDMMLNNYTVLAACANYRMTKADLESQAIQDAVDEQIEEAIEQAGGKKAFREALKESYMTENFMRFSLGVAEMENELYHVLIDDLGVIMKDQTTFLSWLEDVNVAYVQHVFIRNDPADDPEANRALAQSVSDTLKASTDVNKALKSYLKDGKVHEDPSNAAPYYIVRDVYDEKIEKAAFSLKLPGTVSDPVQTEDGYYILVSMEYTSDALWLQIPALLNSYQWAKVEEEVQTFREKTSITLNEYGKSLDLLSIR